MPDTKIKIMISYHTLRCPRIASDILVPVQTGSALTAHLFQGMQYDNDGENISAQNPKYNELSALYWGWKNQDKLGNPDFMGLMHDRRHFIFNQQMPIPNKQVTWLPSSSVYMFPPIGKQYLAYLTTQSIRQYFPAYDVMVLKPYDNVPYTGHEDMRDYFLHSSEMTYEIFDIWADTVKKLYPEYTEELARFSKGTIRYLCNMLVMRKDLFNKYCAFLFSILQAVDKQIDSSHFSPDKLRFLGYLGEFTLSIFMMKLRKNPQVRIIEMNGVFFMPEDSREYHKLTKYKFGKTFLWGKWRKKYQKKYNDLSDKLAVLHFFK